MPPRHVVLLGPPASGKGTQAIRLARALGVPHLSSGRVLRQSMAAGDPFGIRPFVDAGLLVPDEVVEALLVPALGDGFVLDGYPRTEEQARRLDAMLEVRGTPVEVVVELAVDERALVERMGVRSFTEGRSDDLPEVFARRLEEYRRDAPGVRANYEQRLVTVDGSGQPEEVRRRILTALGVA